VPDTNHTISDRLRLAGLTNSDVAILIALGPQIKHFTADIVDAFYKHLLEFAPLRSIIAQHTTVDRLKQTFRVYIDDLFGGVYDESYCAKRLAIGTTHERVGLELDYYLAMFNVLNHELMACVAKECSHRSLDEFFAAATALNRLMTFDQQMAVGAYAQKYADKLRAETTKANAAKDAKSSFLATISHELRTPMTAIIGFTDLVLDSSPDLTPDTKRHLSTVKRNASHLLGLINDLLDLAKIESGKSEIANSVGSVFDLLEDIAICGEQLVGDKSVAIIREFEELNGKRVELDFGKFRQILLNLVSNAAKFTSGGSITIKGQLNSKVGMLEIAITDTGIGMSEADSSAVFEEFRQVEQTLGGRGTGLGLTICRKLVTQLGAKITVSSRLGVGSTFNIVLPVVCL